MASKADILADLKASIAAIERDDASGPDASGAEGEWGACGVAPQRKGSARSAARMRGRTAEESFLAAGPTTSDDQMKDGGTDGPPKTADAAFQKILRWVSVRERSTAYVRERLLKDEFPAEAVEEAVERACRVRAVDDRRYADALVRMRLAAGKGLRPVEREIEELGIDPSSLDSGVEHAEAGREVEVDRALALLRRRPPRAKQVREASFRKLVSQGFSTDIAATAARLWAEEAAS